MIRDNCDLWNIFDSVLCFNLELCLCAKVFHEARKSTQHCSSYISIVCRHCCVFYTTHFWDSTLFLSASKSVWDSCLKCSCGVLLNHPRTGICAWQFLSENITHSSHSWFWHILRSLTRFSISFFCAALRSQAPLRTWASSSQGSQGGMCSDSESAGGSSESRSMDSPTASPGMSII